MRIGELAHRTAVTLKAIRYYERLGLLEPARAANGYREFSEDDVRVVREVRELAELGIPASAARPFIDCLGQGHERGDDCVSSLTVYRDWIDEIDRKVASLALRRDRLAARLREGSSRGFAGPPPHADLPDGLPVPLSDGAADHLPGMRLPPLRLSTSDGQAVELDSLGLGRTVLYLYPLTGRPDADLPSGWDAIPGARGCTAEACGFRDHFHDLLAAGATAVFGLSSQNPAYQAELVERLRLPFAMLSDENVRLADALGLPTFTAEGCGRLFSRLTLIVAGRTIEHVFYPVFPPNAHAGQVLAWLREHPRPPSA